MRKESALTSVSLAVLIVLAVLAQPAAASEVFGAAGWGSTEVTSSTCDALVGGIVPSVLDVDDGDDVWFYYNFTWDDTRSPSSADATHIFSMAVVYGITGHIYQTFEVTNGDTSGSGSHQHEVGSVSEGTYIFFNWTASIDSSTPLCSDSDIKGGGIYLA